MLSACGSTKDLPTVKELDINQYAGTWYEISRLPNSFEKNLDCVTATYRVKDNGKIEVINRGRKTDSNKWKDIKGSARVKDPAYPGRLKVTFFWHFAGDYYVMERNGDYTVALVGSPTRNFLWVLSKSPEMEPTYYQELLKKARDEGFDTDQMIEVNQSCDR